jgi:hypothetical protein
MKTTNPKGLSDSFMFFVPRCLQDYTPPHEMQTKRSTAKRVLVPAIVPPIVPRRISDAGPAPVDP